MSNYIEYNGRVAFHPSYYVQEIFEETGLSQRDFAERLDTTPKNLRVFLKGKQRLSIDLANKLSRMLGTSVEYWLNLQQSYDEMCAEFSSEREQREEREILRLIDYKYFCNNFNLPLFLKNPNKRVKALREFLSIASLTVLTRPSLAVNFRSCLDTMSKSNIVNANAMVQIAINLAIKTKTPQYSQAKFEEAIKFALTLTKEHDISFSKIKNSFREAGVVLVVLPNLKNSGINGATKRLGNKILLMVNDRRHFTDTFWFTLFHEVGHILRKDLGITLDNEGAADFYAQNILIPRDKYEIFTSQNKHFDENLIREFAREINRDPGIVLGRLQHDGNISYRDTTLSNTLRHKYKITINQVP